MKGTSTLKHDFVAYNDFTHEKIFTSTTFSACKDYARNNSCRIYVKSLRTGKWCVMVNNCSMKQAKISCWMVSEMLDKEFKA